MLEKRASSAQRKRKREKKATVGVSAESLPYDGSYFPNTFLTPAFNFLFG